MTESSTAISEIGTSFLERDKDYPNVHFEPGIHPDAKGIVDLRSRFSNGDFNVHGWNREVLERMSQYSPEVIAVDSQSPLSFKDGGIIDPDSLWISLPGKPSEINPTTKEVYVVRGDLTNYNYLFSRTGAKDVGRSMAEQDAKRYFRDGLGIEEFAKIFLGGLSSFTTASLASSEKRITRRNFLKLAAVTTGAAAIARIFNPWLSRFASTSENSTAKDFLIDLYDILGKSLFKKNVTDCRTALLIAKEEDAIDYLGRPRCVSGAVLLGYSHSRRVSELMGSRNKRLEAISLFAEVLVGSLDHALKEHPSVYDRGELTNILLNYISAVEVVKLKDPLVSSDGSCSFEPTTMIMMGTFQSPQVEKAISKYR